MAFKQLLSNSATICFTCPEKEGLGESKISTIKVDGGVSFGSFNLKNIYTETQSRDMALKTRCVTSNLD